MKRLKAIPPKFVVALAGIAASILLLLQLYNPTVFHNTADGTNGGMNTPSATASSASATPDSTTICAAETTWLTRTSKHKKFPHAFGNPVEDGQKNTIWNKLRDYVYTDPAGAAANTAAFDNELGKPNHFAIASKANNRVVNYVSKHQMWCDEVNRMLDTYAKADFSFALAPKHSYTLCMEKVTSGNVRVSLYRCRTTEDENAVTFTFGSHSVTLLLDGHFQPVSDGPFEGEVRTPPKSTPAPKATHTATPKPKPTPKPKRSSVEPDSEGNSGDAGGQNEHPGPGRTDAPSDVPTLPDAPRVNPAPPA